MIVILAHILYVEENWNNLKFAISSTAEEVIGFDRPKAKQKWMTQDILNLMDERKKYRNSNDENDKRNFLKLKHEIQKLLREKKEEYLNNECETAERLEAVDSAKFHKKLKELTYNPKKISYCLTDENGKEMYDSTQMLLRWKQYCQKLYEDERPPPPDIDIEENDIPEFTPETIRNTIKTLSLGKSCGSDNIPSEFVKLLDNDSLILLTDMINSIYKTGIIPSDFLLSTFITLPKVNKAKNCSQFRTISLISHTSKILLQVIKQRISPIIEEHLNETQMGFRAGKGCHDAITVLIEKNIQKDNDVFLSFIDCEKAFDNVNHRNL